MTPRQIDEAARSRSQSLLASLGIGAAGELLVPVGLAAEFSRNATRRPPRSRSGSGPVEYSSSLNAVRAPPGSDLRPHF